MSVQLRLDVRTRMRKRSARREGAARGRSSAGSVDAQVRTCLRHRAWRAHPRRPGGHPPRQRLHRHAPLRDVGLRREGRGPDGEAGRRLLRLRQRDLSQDDRHPRRPGALRQLRRPVDPVREPRPRHPGGRRRPPGRRRRRPQGRGLLHRLHGRGEGRAARDLAAAGRPGPDQGRRLQGGSGAGHGRVEPPLRRLAFRRPHRSGSQGPGALRRLHRPDRAWACPIATTT